MPPALRKASAASSIFVLVDMVQNLWLIQVYPQYCTKWIELSIRISETDQKNGQEATIIQVMHYGEKLPEQWAKESTGRSKEEG
jgi:hypothetical protein